jgi:hypothetical protein
LKADRDVQRHIAEETSLLLLKLNAALDAQLARIQRKCGEGELDRQRLLFGTAMAGLLDIANTIYSDHPDLKPMEMGGPYATPVSALEEAVAFLVNRT